LSDEGDGGACGTVIGEEPGAAICVCGEDVASIGGLRKKRGWRDGRGAMSFLLFGKKNEDALIFWEKRKVTTLVLEVEELEGRW